MNGNVNTQPSPATMPARQYQRPSGGCSERPPAARPAEQQKRDPSDRSNPTDRTDPSAAAPAAPACPACGRPMQLRTARKGQWAGSQFWGCTGFPECRKTQPV